MNLWPKRFSSWRREHHLAKANKHLDRAAVWLVRQHQRRGRLGSCLRFFVDLMRRRDG